MKKNRHPLLRAGLFLLTAAAILAAAKYLQKPAATEPLQLPTPQQRASFLRLRGWQVGEEEAHSAVLPQSWETAAGASWLQMQQTQGLHPENYAGSEAVRYLYAVKDSPNTFAELWLVGDSLVGAEIYSTETGLMQSVR